jgi:hypothetical protein
MKDVPAAAKRGLRRGDRLQAPRTDRIRTAAMLDTTVTSKHEAGRVGWLDRARTDRTSGAHCGRGRGRWVVAAGRRPGDPEPERPGVLGQRQADGLGSVTAA